MAITELLNNLRQLQSFDKLIFGFKAQLKEIPDRIRALDNELATANSKVKQKEAEFRNLQLKRKEKEIDLEQKETTIKKYQIQLYQIKTNKEYAALETEITGLKVDKSLLEEELINIFDEIESAEKAVGEERKRLDEDKRRIEAEKKEINSKKEEIEEKLAEMEEKRKTITPLIDKDILSRYERILCNKSGLAIVPVVGENCGGCFVNLPPQVINEIHLKEKIIYCERCARMLYTED